MIRVLVLLLCFSSASFAQSVLWEITKEGVKDTSYLYGTIHFPNKKYFYVNPKVHEIKKKVNVGAFEIELNNDSLAFIQRAIMAKPGQKISEISTEKERELIFNYFKTNMGLEPLIVDHLLPIALSTQMLQLIMPSDTTGAIDNLLQVDMKGMGKKVVALEDIKMQIDLLLGMPVEVQKNDLVEAIKRPDSILTTFQELDSVYMAQDLEGIGKMLNDLNDHEYLKKDLLNDSRNLKMVVRIEKLLKANSTLICVGAAHLGGVTGLIKLLRDKGFALRPILND